MSTNIRMIWLPLGLGLVLGCTPEFGGSEHDDLLYGEFRDGSGGRSTDAPPGGGTYLGNGLEDPDVSGLDPAYGLITGQGLSTVQGLLTTSTGRNVARYVVECALPEGDWIIKSVAGQVVHLDGRLGLAPEWKSSACDQDCQEWVTACLLARTNMTGQNVDLWVTADHASIGLGLSPDYPVYEATFYGNVFQDPTARYFCLGDDDAQAVASATGRTCTTGAPGDCGFTAFSSCEQDQRCEMVDGVFATDCATGTNAEGARHRSLSTFLPELE